MHTPAFSACLIGLALTAVHKAELPSTGSNPHIQKDTPTHTRDIRWHHEINTYICLSTASVNTIKSCGRARFQRQPPTPPDRFYLLCMRRSGIPWLPEVGTIPRPDQCQDEPGFFTTHRSGEGKSFSRARWPHQTRQVHVLRREAQSGTCCPPPGHQRRRPAESKSVALGVGI